MSEDGEIKTMLADVQRELRGVSEKVIELSTINKSLEEMNRINNSKITTVESDIQFAKGSIALFKGVGLTMMGSAAVFLISFGTWVVQTNQSLRDEIGQLNQSIAVLRSEINFYKSNKGDKHEEVSR